MLEVRNACLTTAFMGQHLFKRLCTSVIDMLSARPLSSTRLGDKLIACNQNVNLNVQK